MSRLWLLLLLGYFLEDSNFFLYYYNNNKWLEIISATKSWKRLEEFYLMNLISKNTIIYYFKFLKEYSCMAEHGNGPIISTAFGTNHVFWRISENENINGNRNFVIWRAGHGKVPILRRLIFYINRRGTKSNQVI